MQLYTPIDDDAATSRTLPKLEAARTFGLGAFRVFVVKVDLEMLKTDCGIFLHLCFPSFLFRLDMINIDR